MKEIVINVDYGGFGLSTRAEREYWKRKGKDVFYYEQTKYITRDGEDEYSRVDDDNKSVFIRYAVNKDLGKCIKELPDDRELWLVDWDIPRDDPDLVHVVRELKDNANGGFAHLKIVKIPDNVDWAIEEYDGVECVSESHRTWS